MSKGIRLQKARVLYTTQWCIETPKEGHAPLLFLEWISQYYSADYMLDVVRQDYTTGHLLISLRAPKEIHEAAEKYINDNL